MRPILLNLFILTIGISIGLFVSKPTSNTCDSLQHIETSKPNQKVENYSNSSHSTPKEKALDHITKDDVSNNERVNEHTQDQEHTSEKTDNPWKEEHKETVSTAIANIAPEHLAESMLKMVLENSEFLNQMENNLSEAENEVWAYEAEYELQSMLMTHPKSADLEISNITCKQLMCELVVKSWDSDSWHDINAHTFRNLSGLIPPQQSETNLRSLQFREDGSIYIYKVLEFKKPD